MEVLKAELGNSIVPKVPKEEMEKCTDFRRLGPNPDHLVDIMSAKSRLDLSVETITSKDEPLDIRVVIPVPCQPIIIHSDMKIYKREARRWRCNSIIDIAEKLGKKPKLIPPIGLTLTSYNIGHFIKEETPTNNTLQSYTTCLVAFGETYITPEEEWNTQILNRILKEGETLLNESKELNEGVEITTESQIRKCFSLCKNFMEVMISPVILVGILLPSNDRVYSFKTGLDVFFRRYNSCLLYIPPLYFLIWRRGDTYFIFDSQGRKANIHRDIDNGTACLICVCCQENIDTIISYMSNFDPESMYTMYEIGLRRILPCCDVPIVCSIRVPNYELVAENHAIVQGKYHIGTDCFRDSSQKQALAIGCMAIVYSKIDAPCTWNTYIVDKILTIGNKAYKEWTLHNYEKDLCIQDIPATVTIGQFVAKIVVFPIVHHGTWKHMPKFKRNEITKVIKKYFRMCNNRSMLIQIGLKSYSLFKRGDFYYVFDPYPAECRSVVFDEQKRAATVHMFSSLDLMCCVFAQYIIQVPVPSPFFVHVVKILAIKKALEVTEKMSYVYSCVDSSVSVNISEASSRTESIFDIVCEKLLKCKEETFDTGFNNLDSGAVAETGMGGAKLEGDESDEEEDEEEGGGGEEGGEGEGEGGEEGGEDDGKGGKKKGKKKGKKGKKGKKKGKKDKKGKKKKEKKKKDKKGKGKKDKKGKGKGKGDKDGKDVIEEEEEFEEEASSTGSAHRRPLGECLKPNTYPGYTKDTKNLAVVGSETGSFQSLCSLIISAYYVADRLLLMTPWGNYIIFKFCDRFFLYDGCTCNPCRFRNYDLSTGTAGFIYFDELHDLIMEIMKGRGKPVPGPPDTLTADDICKEYCNDPC